MEKNLCLSTREEFYWHAVDLGPTSKHWSLEILCQTLPLHPPLLALWVLKNKKNLEEIHKKQTNKQKTRTRGRLICFIFFFFAIVVHSLSCVWLFWTPWTAACQASLSSTISQSLLKLMSIESVMPSNHLILCHLLPLLPSIFPQHQGFFQWVSCSHQVVKVLELQLQHQSFQWMFTVDFL